MDFQDLILTLQRFWGAQGCAVLQPPDPETLKAAAKTLAASFPPEDVTVYLSTLTWQDPDTWGGLVESL